MRPFLHARLGPKLGGRSQSVEKFEEELEDLKVAVESVQDYFKKPEKRDLESLVEARVCPVLEKA